MNVQPKFKVSYTLRLNKLQQSNNNYALLYTMQLPSTPLTISIE